VSDARRNLFILLVVLGLIAGSVAVVLTKPTKLGLDLEGGARLVYQGKPTKQQPTVTQEALDRALDIVRKRVDAFGVSEPEINRAGRDQIEVNLPGVDNAEQAARQVGETAQMFFYDWEPNVLDENCKTNPEEINGGQQPTSGLYEAVKRAAKCPENAAGGKDADNTTSGKVYYAFDKVAKKPFEGVGSEEQSPSDPPGTAEKSLKDRIAGLKPAVPADRVEILSVNEGVVVVREEKNDPDAPDPDLWWVIRDEPVLSGTEIKKPEQNFDQSGGNEPIVTMEFTDKGRKAFAATTRAIAERGSDNRPFGTDEVSASHHFAIRLDEDLISKPYINFRENPEGIDGRGGAQISGGFTITSAQNLAQLLKIGALPIKLEEISRSQVSATLGKQALDQGLKAAIAGFIIVALFLLTFYRVLGVIAVAALAIYALYFYALIKLIPITLTLPGIAGLVLTLGVAADANIVIFERVKEEIRAGRSIAAGLAAGYKKGFATILDANIVTLLVAFVLFILATAGVKGFAFTLGVGTILSLLTAVLATQAILLSMRNTRMLSKRSALGAGDTERSFRWDFMGASKWFFSASGVILLVGALAIAVNGLNFGIDFEAGSRVTASLKQAASVDQVREALTGIEGAESAKIQAVDNPDLGANVVQVAVEEGVSSEEIRETLNERFGEAQAANVEEVGPTFGETVANNAWRAILISLLVISAYIALRFEWKFAVPVLIALMHDILITAGVYSLTGREVTSSTVAALLTILGFSLYDTIIVFDRIRENVPRMPSAAFSQIVNRSMSEVIVRSLATSFCTGLPVAALLIFGGETLQDFAFALLVGVASGTYSSVFIAGPVLTHWKEREPLYLAREKRIKAELGHVPAYATAVGGGPVDVAPTARRRGSTSLTAPQDPTQVSQAEFDAMVRDLGVEGAEEATAGPAARAAGVAPARRPAGGRRARRAAGGNGTPQDPGAGASPAGPAPKTDDQGRPKKPRNKKHGRPR
jgi:SecD/SecF fusion protein